MSNMYPDNNRICEHGAVCIDPAYHEQYHCNHTHYNHPEHNHDCPCCQEPSSNNTTNETEYNGLPRYDHPHPYPHPKCDYYCNHKYNRTLLRDEEVGNIIRVESIIIESLLVKLYSCVANKDVFVKMELGTKYSIKWIDVDGVNSCTGMLVDFKASQHSTIYQPTNADGYYIVMDCSEVGKSDIKKILISSIRDIIEVVPEPDPVEPEEPTAEPETPNNDETTDDSSTEDKETTEENTTDSGNVTETDTEITQPIESEENTVTE